MRDRKIVGEKNWWSVTEEMGDKGAGLMSTLPESILCAQDVNNFIKRIVQIFSFFFFFNGAQQN